MAFTNSSLVTYTKLLKNGHYNPRNREIAGITIHHNAGVASVPNLLNYAYNTDRQMSFNYCVNDDDIGLSVEEKNRAWTSSNAANDHRCVTIEVCNSSTGGNWPISDKSMATVIKLCADICKRNGIKKLFYDGTTNGTLTRHEMFASTNCPGPYIKNHTDYICSEVNKLIGAESSSGDKEPEKPVATDKYEVVCTVKGYYTSANAIARKDAVRNVEPGTYYVYNKVSGAVNVTKTASAPGAWINTTDNVAPSGSDNPIGKEVIINGQLFGNSTGGNPGKTVSNVRTKITRYAKGAAKPYNTTGDLGWVAESSVTFVHGSSSSSSSSSSGGKKKVTESVVNDVINGKYGNGDARKKALEAAGYDYSEVQDAVNAKLSGKSTSISNKKSIDEIAKEVIRGDWGNGDTRKKKLEAAGYNYSEVQKRVNELL